MIALIRIPFGPLIASHPSFLTRGLGYQLINGRGFLIKGLVVSKINDAQNLRKSRVGSNTFDELVFFHNRWSHLGILTLVWNSQILVFFAFLRLY